MFKYPENKKTSIFIPRILSLVIICAVIFSCVLTTVSCKFGKQGETAMTLTYGDNTTVFSSNIYSYYLSSMKTTALYEYISMMYNMYGLGNPTAEDLTDFPELWVNEISEGITYGAYVKERSEESLKQMLAIVAYCKENNLSLSKDEINNVDEMIKEILKDAKYNNSKARLNDELLKFNIDDTIFKEIKQYEALLGVFSRYLFDAGTGKRIIPEDMINQVYEQECVRIKHILIPSSPGTADEDGNPIAYTEEELIAIQAKIDDLYERISNGEDFDSLLPESADTMTADGYTITSSTGFVEEFKTAALGLEIGEVCKVDSEYGTHIIKRFELLPSTQAVDIDTGDTWRNNLYKQAQTLIVRDELTPYIEKIEVNTAETNLFDITTSTDMFKCMELWMN